MIEDTIDAARTTQLRQRSAERLFNAEAALERLDGDVELFVTLVAVFQQDSVGLFEQLASGMACGDLARIERAAHSLKGLAANFDATEATQVASIAEDMARAGDADGLAAVISELGVQLEMLRQALAQWTAD